MFSLSAFFPFSVTHIGLQVTEHHSYFARTKVSAVPGSQTMPEEQVENTVQLAKTAGTKTLDHMTTPTLFPTLPSLFSPTAIKISGKHLSLTAKETICYSKYGEV